ncbi:MAG: hypothetical protein H6566_19935 [Lewinellaceae bacterium]|nr:hypothetical protein [Lewinellaceae bacterium]
MPNRILSLLALTALLTLTLNAQTFTDALRYSHFEVNGTARSIGVGGALGALGSDFSVLSTNPAGLGWYRSSEFVIAPSFYNARTESLLVNDKSNAAIEESRTNFNLSAFGVVVASRPRSANWSTFNFGIGLNRLANFNQNYFYRGESEGSIVDRFQEQANSDEGISDFESGVAIDAEALYDQNPQDGFYESDFELAPDAVIRRQQSVDTRGSINELVFSFAGNYKERLLIGATIGVPFLNFREEKGYQEEDVNDEVPFFQDLTYTERLTTTGAGINLKLGMIYRVDQALRLGLAVHTPTGFSLSDSYRTTMDYNYLTSDDGTGDLISGSAESPDGLFDYKLRTPWRLIGSAGFIYNKLGFLSAEIEWVDYSNNELRYDGFADAEREANSGITNQLGGAWNLRLGGELAFEVFRFRAGLGLQQSPLIDDTTISNTISAGFGIREKNFFIDLAYQRRSTEEDYKPYLTALSAEQIVQNNVTLNQYVFTLGFRF